MMNGEICKVTGTGVGSVERGKLAIDLAWSNMPLGLSVIVSSMWTVCCSSPTFALERGGGMNMININRAHYRCERTFDFGKHGSYEYWFENHLEGDEMTARGTIRGNVNLPPLVGVDDVISELMIPVSSNEIRSFARGAFICEDGTSIPAQVIGRYTKITPGEWNSSVRDQARRSYIQITKHTKLELGLEYSTIIEAIRYPEFPAALPSREQLLKQA
jgi:hypothetical protein